MDEEEIEEMSLEDTEKAEQKRRAFEEKLEKEAKEKERKKLQADQKLQEAEKVKNKLRIFLLLYSMCIL